MNLLSFHLPTSYNQMMDYYIERVIFQMQRFKSMDFGVYDVPIRVIICDITDTDCPAVIRDSTRSFFLDRIEYIDGQSFTVYMTGMTDDPEKYTMKTIEVANIDRKPGTQQRFVVHKDNGMKPPFIQLEDMHLLMRYVEMGASFLDGKSTGAEMGANFDINVERINFLADVSRFFDLSEVQMNNVQQLIVEIQRSL